MKLSLHPIIVVLIYIVTQLCFELAKEFNTIGAANLRKYDTYDWIILAVTSAGSIGITIKAFIDPCVTNYRNMNGRPPVVDPPNKPNENQTPNPPAV